MTTLPLRIPPHEDEAWHGYLVRTATHYRTSVTTLADHIGLRRAGRWPGYHGVTLDQPTTATAASGLNLEPRQVTGMQLATYDQLAFDLTGLDVPQRHRIAGTRRVSQQGWVFLAGSRYCPACLHADGVWLTEWRIPWITTCIRHQLWLEHQCPSCGGVPGLYNGLHATAPSRTGTRPGTKYCDLPVGRGVCAANLTATPPRPAPPEAVSSTRRFRETVDANHGVVAGTSHSSLQTLRAWQAAIGICISLGRSHPALDGRAHRWSSQPRDATTFQELVTAASPIVQAPGAEEAAATLLDWCRAAGVSSPNRHTFTRATRPASALTPITDATLAQVGRAHIRLARRRHATTPTLPLRGWTPADVPQVIWSCALPPDRRTSTRPNHLLMRAVLAMILVRMHGGDDWPTAGAVLGIPRDKARNWTRHCFAQRFPGLREDLLHTADHVADLLPTQPERNAWKARPDIADGFGFFALARAQSPTCRREDPASPWCPCTTTKKQP